MVFKCLFQSKLFYDFYDSVILNYGLCVTIVTQKNLAVRTESSKLAVKTEKVSEGKNQDIWNYGMASV